MKSLNLQSPTLGITIFTSQGKRSHWIFLYEKLSKVTEKWTVTEKNLHRIYIPRIPVPEFAVTKAKNTEFSYNRRYLETWYLDAVQDLETSEADTEVGVL